MNDAWRVESLSAMEAKMSYPGYYVARTTTDKLAGILNGFEEGYAVTQITHVGGRDWVVIAEVVDSFDTYEERDEWAQAQGMV